jgi:hypothetical protein
MLNDIQNIKDKEEKRKEEEKAFLTNLQIKAGVKSKFNKEDAVMSCPTCLAGHYCEKHEA